MFTRIQELIKEKKYQEAKAALEPLYTGENAKNAAYAGYLLGYINTCRDNADAKEYLARRYLRENTQGDYPHPYAYVAYSRLIEDKNVALNAKRKFVIFQKIRADAVEILTPQERLANIAKEERKDVLYRLIVAYTWVLLILTRFFGPMFVHTIYSNQTLLLCAVWLALAFSATIRFFHFLFWKRSWAKKAENGEDLYFGKAKNPFAFASGWHTQLSTGVILAFTVGLFLTKQFETLLLILGLVVVLITMAFVIARLRPDAVIHQIVQIVVAVFLMIAILIVPITMFTSDETVDVETAQIPLYYDDIDGEAGRLEKADFHQRSSIFGSAMSCWLEHEEDTVTYYVYKSDHPWVIDKIWKEQVMDNYHLTEENVTDLWNAELAYKTGSNHHSAKYSDAVIIISFVKDMVLTPEKVDTICSALLESR